MNRTMRGNFLICPYTLPYYTPFVRTDSKPEPSDCPALATFDVKVDRKSKFPVSLLARATVCQTIADAHLQSELIKGVYVPP
jgi:hypothetical protein